MNININFARLERLATVAVLCCVISLPSCIRKEGATDICHTKRDRMVQVRDLVCPFDTDTVIVSGKAWLYADDSHLFFKENQPEESVVYAFNPQTLMFEGAFGKPGPGPDEILMPGAMALNPNRGEVYIIDHGQLKIMAYNVDSALTCPDYHPWVKQTIVTGGFPDRYVYVNDTLVPCRHISMPTPDSFTQRLGIYNIITGSITDFAPEEHSDTRLHSLFDVSARDSLLVETVSEIDLIKIYDLKGRVIHRIKGPDYSENVEKGTDFFLNPVITHDFILVPRKIEDRYAANEILVLSHDGEYLGTADIGYELTHTAYAPKQNRLFMVFDDETEMYGFIDLDDLKKRL